jgi:translation initiation factor 2 beta subunit (eIF-2beta)/eIF-5
MISSRQDFLKQVDLFKQQLSNHIHLAGVSRTLQNMPSLTYKTQGKYLYIENYQALCSYVNRTIDHLSKYLSNHLGCICEVDPSYMRMKGNLKIFRIRQAIKQFYTKEILCTFCQSPETNRISDDMVTCLNCLKSDSKNL